MAVLALSLTTTSASDGDPQGRLITLADFESPDVARNWKTVNDNVMGGRSKGGPSFNHGILTFTGSTNTNGGGFSSVRSNPNPIDLTGNTGLLMRVRGDGRTYKVSLRTDVSRGRWEVPFRSDFQTLDGVWLEVYVPFDSFTPTIMGQRLNNPPALDPAEVRSMGFMIYDQQDGPFVLEVDWVKAVNHNATQANAKD